MSAEQLSKEVQQVAADKPSGLLLSVHKAGQAAPDAEPTCSQVQACQQGMEDCQRGQQQQQRREQ